MPTRSVNSVYQYGTFGSDDRVCNDPPEVCLSMTVPVTNYIFERKGQTIYWNSGKQNSPGPYGCKYSYSTMTDNSLRGPTFDVKAVSPAEFSLVCRPLCGPGLGFSPLTNASRILLVVSGVKSSYKKVSERRCPWRKIAHKSRH